MSKKPLVLLIAASLTLAACASAPEKPAVIEVPAAVEPAPVVASNPLLTPSTLYLQAPPWNEIKDEHYQPALEEGMRQQTAEVRAIADNKDAPTFDNTIVAMERSGQLLSRARSAFSIASGTLKNDYIQKVESDLAPKFAAHYDAITLDAPLFARIHTLYEDRNKLGLDPVSIRLIERYHLDFVRSGALLSDADKQKMRDLNTEESKLTTKFSENLLQDTKASALVVDKVSDLDGLSPGEIDAAAAAAKSRGLEGKWVIPLVNFTLQPKLSSLTNRDVRERLYKLSLNRNSHGGEYDNNAVIARLAQLRAQKAQLLGFATYANYVLDDQMAKTPDAAMKLLSQVGKAAVRRAKTEIADMQRVIDAEKGGFKLQPWDWGFYAEKVRKQKYDLDESQTKPYFELDHVLKDGVFYAAHQMYGVSFKQRTDLPVWTPDVRAWEVFDKDGSTIGIFYTDYYAREGKRGGAWMSSFVDQSDLMGFKPVIYNQLNVPKPSAGPTLLTWDEVTTLFHEFGHGLHGLFSQVKYPYMSGTSTPRDFVEFPSQFNENWALEPTVLANYAKHYQTGAPMPKQLLDKVQASSKFNQGFTTTEYLAAALLDQRWHQLAPNQIPTDALAFEAAALKSEGVDYAPIPPRYRSTYFSHIWGGGYSAGYYAYLWSEVLDAGSVEWLKKNGGLTRKNGDHFRDTLLSRGGSSDAVGLYRTFTGEEPDVGPLLKRRGLDKGVKK